MGLEFLIRSAEIKPEHLTPLCLQRESGCHGAAALVGITDSIWKGCLTPLANLNVNQPKAPWKPRDCNQKCSPLVLLNDPPLLTASQANVRPLQF